MQTNRRPSAFTTEYTEYQLTRSWSRRLVRHFYLTQAARRLAGPTIDFGCGVGDLLQRLPDGSVGLEINQTSVDACRRLGIDTFFYDGEADGYRLTPLRETGRRFDSLAICHVLEHLEKPIEKFNSLLRAAESLGVERVLVIVPGRAGFASDPTHRTFVDRAMLLSNSAVQSTSFKPTQAYYFPINVRWLGSFFTHHELCVCFGRQP